MARHDDTTTITAPRRSPRLAYRRRPGPTDGPVVLLCHAAPGLTLLDPDPRRDRRDRRPARSRSTVPGYGASTAAARRRRADDPDGSPSTPPPCSTTSAWTDAVVAGWSARWPGRCGRSPPGAPELVATPSFLIGAAGARRARCRGSPSSTASRSTMMRDDVARGDARMVDDARHRPPTDPAEELAVADRRPGRRRRRCPSDPPACAIGSCAMLAEAVSTRAICRRWPPDIVSYTRRRLGLRPVRPIGAPDDVRRTAAPTSSCRPRTVPGARASISGTSRRRRRRARRRPPRLSSTGAGPSCLLGRPPAPTRLTSATPRAVARPGVADDARARAGSARARRPRHAI